MYFFAGCAVFPEELQQCGLTEDVLQRAFFQVCEGNSDLCWRVQRPVSVGFYRELNNYLRKWPPSKSATKTAVGKFFLSIDSNFQSRISSRPDNVYAYVQRIAMSDKPHSEPMSYGIEKTVEKLQSVVSEYKTDLQEMSETVLKQQKELQEMRIEIKKAKAELTSSRYQLSDVTNKLDVVTVQRDRARKEVHRSQQRLQAATADAVHYEEEILTKNEELSDLVKKLKNEISTLSGSKLSLVSDIDRGSNSATFCFQTKEGGKVYTSAIRELYYMLLANQLPPAKIASVIKTILKSFLPSLNVESLQLPGESCALYMRREELTTLNLAHKATCLLEQTQSGSMNLNSDGTTKSQKKIQGAALNDIIISVNEVPDGSADSMISDISQELKKLREIAHALRLPNADKINWTLIQSSSSDSAATQKRFNKLLKKKRQEDREKFGPVCPEALELVENFCCMHLGVNLRKAFFDGVKIDTNNSMQRDNPRVDVLVHEFCKLFGKHGVPEYGLGTLAFPDFLQLNCNSEFDQASYYEQCTKIKLDRQVGNRYFVTAANAGKILFLRDAAIDFLKYSGKDKGNKLEQSVFEKLEDPEKLAHLTADSVMFHHVYSNLVMLAKSTDLNKSVIDMNEHYLELQLFLEEVEKNPKTAMNANYAVFKSEPRLYGMDKKTNHRLHASYKVVEESIFNGQSDETLLYSLLRAGASAMKEKLSTYAMSQLPGGKYWDPDPEIKAILKTLKPNNDICESTLGLNDYLSTAIPNMKQMTRSNLIQVKKNKVLQWLGQLSCD